MTHDYPRLRAITHDYSRITHDYPQLPPITHGYAGKDGEPFATATRATMSSARTSSSLSRSGCTRGSSTDPSPSSTEVRVLKLPSRSCTSMGVLPVTPPARSLDAATKTMIMLVWSTVHEQRSGPEARAGSRCAPCRKYDSLHSWYHPPTTITQ